MPKEVEAPERVLHTNWEPRPLSSFSTRIEEVDVFDGTVIAHRILTQTGRVQSLKGSRAADLVARIRRGKVTEAAV